MDDRKQELIRISILGGIVTVIFLLFAYQLTMVQIAQGEYYKDKATAGTTTKQMVPAVRGEIVDRYGRPFTTNRVGYNIILDRTYLPYGKENDVLLSLMGVMQEMEVTWIDNLPISANAPFTFLDGKDAQVARLKKACGLNEYATAEDCMSWLAGDTFYRIGVYDENKKRTGDLDPATTRKLAGVRYEMVQNAFSLENTYTFAADVGAVVRDTVLERAYMLPGVDVVETPVREYVEGTLAPHILGRIAPMTAEKIEAYKLNNRWYDAKTNATGYRADEYTGESGIEYYFESMLRGKRGERLITLDNKGNVEDVQDTVPPTPGNTVVLTLDKDLQRAAQNALETVIKGFNANPDLRHDQGKDANAGAAVVLDPKTFEVLAMATYPSYDNNTYLEKYAELATQKPEPLLNRATQGVYRPGSTYKPVMATAGLAEGVITPTETINCTHIYQRFLATSDFGPQCMHYDGLIPVTTALQRSCNIFFYETGWRLGIDRQNEYAAHFGLGQATGLEIGEKLGRLSSPAFSESMGAQWYPGNVVQTAIGQLDHAFTPAQMAAYVATLANNGVRMNEHLVKAIKSYDFKVTVSETVVKEVARVPAPQEAFDVVRGGMVAATGTGGTSGWLWTGFPLTVASKTGSPESGELLDSAYICYIPAEDPQIAIAVILEKGGQGYTGAPVARKIAEEYFFGGNKTETVPPMGTLLP